MRCVNSTGAIDAVVTQMRRALDNSQERRNLIVEGGDVLNAHLNLAKTQRFDGVWST